ncbi:MAG: hypothetical protein ACYS9T_01155 [Planctomycetota bacterium]|jgi:hypothetical protein
MESDKHNRKLDELISRAIGRDRPTFDFDKWRKDHQKEIQIYESHAGAGVRPLRQADVWRIIMKSQITKLATAAVFVAIAAILVVYVDGLGPVAYALDQTVRANHSVRYLHIADFNSVHEEPSEIWARFDEIGQLEALRVHVPEWRSPHDGAKYIVWKDNLAKVWLKKRNVLYHIRETNVAAKMLETVEKCDPKLAVEHLYRLQTQEKVEIKIDQPDSKAEPIVVTATYLAQSSTPDRREVLYVDQATKLVTEREIYKLKDGEYEFVGAQEYYDYNQAIDPVMFTLDKIPADALHLDWVNKTIGLAQGDLSDNEIAVKLVRSFFEALIAYDYAEAGRIYQGIPADRLEQAFGKSILRIISIGRPEKDPKYGKLRVPCAVEIEKDGKIIEWQPHSEGILVGPIQDQPQRWTIFGGI